MVIIYARFRRFFRFLEGLHSTLAGDPREGEIAICIYRQLLLGCDRVRKSDAMS